MRQNLDKEHLLKLTLAVYKVTAIFPKGEDKEGLGSKIRDLAAQVLANFILCEEKCSLNIDEILGLFDLAEEKNWVDPRNFSVLRREYEVLFGVGNRTDATDSNNHRQDKILAVMAGNGAVKIGDLVKLFPGVNRRTVLRDLGTLCQTGVIVRNGNGRGAFYIKNGHQNETLLQ